MRTTYWQRWLTLAAGIALVQGGQAVAQTPGPELTAGFSTVFLRPSKGTDERLKGWELGGRYGLDPAWALEGALSRQTGSTRDGVDQRQVGVRFGPRYSWNFNRQWQVFGHVQVGWEQFSAWKGEANVQSHALAFIPGLGVEFAASPHLALRVREDLEVTHYAGQFQRSPVLYLGLAFRLGHRQKAPAPSMPVVSAMPELPPAVPRVPTPLALAPAQPVAPVVAPAPVPSRLRILFAPGQAEVSAQANRELQTWVARVKALPRTPSLQVQGHADTTGGRRFNQRLSRARARKAAALVVAAGLPVNRVEGHGSDQPVAPNGTRAGRHTNRRVEVIPSPE